MGLNFGQNMFPARGEFSVNYDWTDVANATGYESYYGYNTNDGDYGVINSTDVASVDEMLSPSVLLTPGIDFDILFNTPRTVRGNLVINTPFAFSSSSTSSQEITLTAVVYHYDGSSETSLGTDSCTLTVPEDGFRFTTITIPVGLTHFKKGEILRINLIIASSYTYMRFGMDPKDREMFTGRTEYNHSRMAFYVPFRIES